MNKQGSFPRVYFWYLLVRIGQSNSQLILVTDIHSLYKFYIIKKTKILGVYEGKVVSLYILYQFLLSFEEERIHWNGMAHVKCQDGPLTVFQYFSSKQFKLLCDDHTGHIAWFQNNMFST